MSGYCLVISVHDTNELFNVCKITEFLLLISILSSFYNSLSIYFGSGVSIKCSCWFIKDAKCMLISFYSLRSWSTVELCIMTYWLVYKKRMNGWMSSQSWTIFLAGKWLKHSMISFLHCHMNESSGLYKFIKLLFENNWTKTYFKSSLWYIARFTHRSPISLACFSLFELLVFINFTLSKWLKFNFK